MARGRDGFTGVVTNTIAPKSAEQAILVKQDAIIDILVDLMTKLDADTGVNDADYSDLVAALAKVVIDA